MREEIDVYSGFKNRAQLNGDKENPTKRISAQSDLIAVHKGFKSKIETKVRLEELKKQMEMDFEGKYKTFKGIDQDVRTSEQKLRILMAVKKKKNPAQLFKGSLSEDVMQQTLDLYSGIYTNVNKTTKNKPKHDLSDYPKPIREVAESNRLDTYDYASSSNTHKSTLNAKLKMIATNNRRKSFNISQKTSTDRLRGAITSKNQLTFN